MNKENDRSFLYRAKTLDTQKWVIGYIYDNTPLYCFKEDADRLGKEIYILTPGFADWGMPRPMEKYRIDPKTICKYINYLDSNKNKIFENDIVSFGSTNGHIYHQELIWFNNEIQAMTAVPLDEIEYNGWDYYNNKYNKFNYETFCAMLQDPWGDYSKIEIIGNIFDNPELIKKEF